MGGNLFVEDKHLWCNGFGNRSLPVFFLAFIDQMPIIPPQFNKKLCAFVPLWLVFPKSQLSMAPRTKGRNHVCGHSERDRRFATREMDDTIGPFPLI